MPQQGTPGRITKLEKTVAQLNTGKLSRSDAISIIASEGFNDVVPRFHTIGRDRRFAENYFYEADFGKSLRLKDSLLNLATTELDELLEEVDARWSLLEGAFEINHSEIDLNLANDIRKHICYPDTSAPLLQTTFLSSQVIRGMYASIVLKSLQKSMLIMFFQDKSSNTTKSGTSS